MRKAIMFLLPLALLGLLGCAEKGPMEKAGEQADNAVEEAQQKLDDAVDTAKDKIEEGLDEAADIVE